MTDCHVDACTRPTSSGYLCEPCLIELADALRDFPILAKALDATFAQEQRFTVSRPRRVREPGEEEESPLPINEHAGRLRRELSRELLRWTFNTPRARLALIPRTRHTTQAMSSQLLNNLDHYRANKNGPLAHRTFTSLHTRILRAVDRPPDLIYLGTCSNARTGTKCPQDLYAEWGATFIKCNTCGHDHNVADRRSTLILAVKDQLANAADISRGLAGLGMGVTAERVRQWKQRNRLISRGVDLGKHPLYRVGDVIDLVMAENERRTA